MSYKDDYCDEMFNDPEYNARMEEQQRYDHEVMGELWKEEFSLQEK